MEHDQDRQAQGIYLARRRFVDRRLGRGAVTTALNAAWAVMDQLGGSCAPENLGPGVRFTELAPILLPEASALPTSFTIPAWKGWLVILDLVLHNAHVLMAGGGKLGRSVCELLAELADDGFVHDGGMQASQRRWREVSADVVSCTVPARTLVMRDVSAARRPAAATSATRD